MMDHKLITITAVLAVPDYGGKYTVCARDMVGVDEDAFLVDWNETELTVVEETPEG